ncbi:alpha/beta hydrolase [Streptomyces coeruleorubidus]|uniref:alpha/beta hydrolase n=1 Tax=Streptomyces coeruleorubidus TaxID=116188 RepID=UPI0036F80878
MSTHDGDVIERANAADLTPVVFVHGLWLLPSNWDRWAEHFEQAGYAPVPLSWPDDPDTVEEANRHPGVFAGKTVGQVADHLAELIGGLKRKPAVIGHSFGGLLTQILAGRGLSAASVAIDPAPFRGVLPLPLSSLRSAAPVLTNPAHHNRAVPLTFDQFNPWTEAKADTAHPERGPLLIISGEKDHTVPWALSSASYRRQRRNPGITEIIEIKDRGHSLTIDHGWQEVADTALTFVRRFV